jgi:hypothetical protein
MNGNCEESTLRKRSGQSERKHAQTGSNGANDDRWTPSKPITDHSPRHGGAELGETEGRGEQTGMVAEFVSRITHVLHHERHEREQNVHYTVQAT